MHNEPGTPLPFAACENFRELGGYTGLGGKTVRRGVFYRTPALANIVSEHDKALFNSLGIRVVFDFRSSSERAARPDPAFPGVENVAVSALTNPDGTEVDFNFDELVQGGEPALRGMMEDVRTGYARMPFGNRAYKALFAAIAQRRTPLAFHCTAGKDRTGVAAALILTALGVSHDDVLRDYLLTNGCRAANRARMLAQVSERLPAALAQRLVDECAGVRAESLQASLDAIAARYASFEEYLAQECDFSAAQLAQMRADYLV